MPLSDKIKSFEEELNELLDWAKRAKVLFEELQEKVHELHRKHKREIPPPITGTLKTTDPQDKFR